MNLEYTKKSLGTFTYQQAKERIERYCLAVLAQPKPLNEYVPNSHICNIFLEVYQILNFENLVGLDLMEKSRCAVLPHIEEYFKADVELTPQHLHEVYQMLRRTEDYLRNTRMLVSIRWERMYTHFLHINSTDYKKFHFSLLGNNYDNEVLSYQLTPKGNLKKFFKDESKRAENFFKNLLRHF